MPIDRKYGRVTLENQRNVGDDELVVVFRGMDRLLPYLLSAYHQMCINAGSPRNHIDSIGELEAEVEHWQAEHGSQIPKSEGFSYVWQGPQPTSTS